MLLKKIVGNPFKKNTKKIAFSGISAGMCVAVIFIGSMLDLIDMSTAALAGIIVFISIYKTDLKYSLGTYVTSSVLSFVLVSQKSASILFALIFGLYPFIWYFSIKIKKMVISYLIKLLLFNSLAFLSIFLLKELIAGYIDEPVIIWILLILIANAAFLLYDYLFSILWFNMTGCFYGITIPLKFIRNKK